MATVRVPTRPRHGSWTRTTVGRSTPCTQSGHGTLMAPSTIGYHSGMARGLGDMRTSAAREDTPTVTTSLQPTATKPSPRRMTEPRVGLAGRVGGGHRGAAARGHLGIGTDEFKRVTRTAVTLIATISLTAFLTKVAGDLSRFTVALSMLLGLVYVTSLRYAARRVLGLLRRHGRACHRVLLVGSLAEALEVYTAVTRNRNAGMIPVAIHLSDGYPTARTAECPVPVHAGREVVPLVHELGADTVAVCGAASTEPGELRRLRWQPQGTGVDLVVAPQLTDIAGPRVHIRPVEGLPLLYVEEPTLSGIAWLFKNLLDRFVAALGLLLFSPVMAAVAIGIRARDNGPGFF